MIIIVFSITIIVDPELICSTSKSLMMLTLVGSTYLIMPN